MDVVDRTRRLVAAAEQRLLLEAARSLGGVRGPHPRPRRPGRRHRGRAALGRRLRRGRHAQAFPSFGSERTGAPVVVVLPDRRPPDPHARADRRARRADRPGPDAAAPGRRLRRPAARRLRADQHGAQRSPSSASATSSAAFDAGRVVAVPATRARARAPRPAAARTRPLLGGFAALTGVVSLDALAAAIRERFPGDVGERQRRAPPRPRTRSVRARPGARPCLGRSRARAAVAETVALCRPEVICAYPISPQTHIVEGLSALVKSGRARAVRVHQRRVRVRRDVGRDRRVGRPARAPTPRPPARACSTWSRRSTTPSGLGLPIVMTVANRAIGAPINIWNDHSRLDVAARLRLDPALRRVQPGGARPAHPGVPAGRGALAAGDGVHGRLHPHPRLRAGRRARPRSRSTRSCRRSSRARCSTPTTR